MLNTTLPASPPIRIEMLDVSQDLLAALQKAAAVSELSNAERFEIAALTFMVARALTLRKKTEAATPVF
jgi:hypothetical protein